MFCSAFFDIVHIIVINYIAQKHEYIQLFIINKKKVSMEGTLKHYIICEIALKNLTRNNNSKRE